MVRQVFFNPKLALVLLLYLILATIYSVVVPIGRGADEWAHYWYAQFIAQNGRLPATPAEREAAGYKSDWPPLYHLFAAGVTAWIETDGPPTFKYRQDNIRRQLVPAQGPEAILHTEDELFPWQQEILVWHLGRFLSIGFTLGSLGVTYFIGLEIFATSRRIENRPPGLRPKTLALIAVAVLAFNPRFLFTGMLFNYDSLTLLLASLFLWLVIRIARGYYPRWGFWGVGALAGLALVTKYLAALLPLEIVAVAIWRAANPPANDAFSNNLIALFRRNLSHFIHLSGGRRLAVYLSQAAIALVVVASWWVGYLLLNFNEIETYGPVLGTLSPLIRGDGSDRTVEQIFAFISDGQAPPPAYIEKQSYTAWQIVTELPATFWGNPITQPYPLNWFIGLMTLLAAAAAAGLVILWRRSKPSGLPRRLAFLLLLHSALPLPLMLIRLFGARDALEAVQGRHILFLSGPAVAILLVWGLSQIVTASRGRGITGPTSPALHFSFYLLLALLLTGATGQLIYMAQVYPPLLPVRTTFDQQAGRSRPEIRLAGGARVIDYSLQETEASLRVSLIWQAGPEPPPEDYQMELALVDGQGQTQSGWLAYQTQAHYPSRAWEAGDIIRDDGWLPLAGLAAGDYQVRLRFLGQQGEVLPWQTLTGYTLAQAKTAITNQGRAWLLWRQGQIARHRPTFRERETIQLSLPNLRSPAGAGRPDLQLIDPVGMAHAPASAGATWANFIAGPDWPAGDYRLQAGGQTVLRLAPNDRNFQLPAEMAHPLEANFAGQIKLLGYRLPTRRVQPGDGLPVTLYWQGLQWMGQNFVIFTRLLDNPHNPGQQVAWGGYDRLARENYSTLFWAPGEIVTDGFAVPVAAAAPHGVYQLSLGWYQTAGGQAQSLPIIDPDTGQPTPATAVTIGPIKVGGPPPGITVTEATPQHKIERVLGEQIKLLGFTAESPVTNSLTSTMPALSDSSPLQLTLYWQALAVPEADYTVFVHLRDEQGKIVAQSDNPPAGGRYPTGLWEAGEIIKDEVTVTIGPLEWGPYELVVGMYNFSTGERLPVAGSPDGAILLQSFKVGE